MSGSKAQAVIPNTSNQESKRGGFGSLARYALLGGAAAAIIAAVELIDLHILLTPVLDGLADRLKLTAYFSLNFISGTAIGLLIGLVILAGSRINMTARSLLSRLPFHPRLVALAAGLFVVALAALLLNQQPHIYGYMIALTREAEKLSPLRSTLLNHERATSYLLIAALFMVCWGVFRITGASARLPSLLRIAWLSALIALAGAAYYVDSRIEVQGYEYSLHRSMFLAANASAIALTATIYLCWLKPRWQALQSAKRRKVAVLFTVLIAACGAFTMVRFGKDQNLKTQIFYRTTQAKQHFRLMQWLLDYDRDGYSALLGGGDPDDASKQINPGMVEVIGDGLDNNCIGGDLTEHDLADWNREREARHQMAGSSAERLNVIFIFIDALRADHLSTYGYGRQTTPNIDRLAEKSSVFLNAHTPAPNTFEALPKFMQSNHWDGHLESWTEVLARSGYHTILFPGRTPTMLRHVKGVQTVSRAKPKGLGEKMDLIIKTLEDHPADRPFSAFVYAVDPHRPYKKHSHFHFGPTDTDLYDGEIAYTDHHIGRLFEWMRASGKDKDTLVVIMADHGESLGERSVYKHSRQLYNEQTQVPMIIYHPRLAPRRIPDYVSTIDLGSTILASVGIARPRGYSGVSLLSLMRGEPFTHPPVFAEQTTNERSPYVRPDQGVTPEAKKYMVITQDGFKLIYNRNYSCFELYDLNQDPLEEHNLYDHQPGKADEMKRLLGRFIDVLSVSRPWDADESQYTFGKIDDNDEDN